MLNEPMTQGPSESELNGAVRNAEYAKRSLDDPMFKKACKHVFEGIAAQRAKCPLADHVMATKLIIAEQVANEVIGYFERAVQDGEVAAFELRRRQTVFQQLRNRYEGDPRGW